MFPFVYNSESGQTFAEFFNFTNGKKRPNTHGSIPVYGGNGILAYTNQSNAENCIIIGRVGAYCGNTYLCSGKCWVSDNAILATDKTEALQLFAYYLLKNAALPLRHIGTGQPLMTQGILNSIPCQIPEQSKIRKFNDICSVLQGQIDLNQSENNHLAAIRDSLLPRLMSGELDVSSLDI